MSRIVQNNEGKVIKGTTRSLHRCRKLASVGSRKMEIRARLANAGVIANENGQETIDSFAATVSDAMTLKPEDTDEIQKIRTCGAG